MGILSGPTGNYSGWLLAAFFIVLTLGGCGEEPPPPSNQSQSRAPASKTPPKPGSLELLFVYGSEKEAWLEDVTQKFNRQNPTLSDGQSFRIKTRPMGSGESVDEVLAGRLKAHLLSPASEAFIKLGNAQSQVKTGKDLIASTENLVLSPVVIAMWKPMAEALGWGEKAVGWRDILEMAKDQQGWAKYDYPQWGRFKFGHTHPDYSNSGLISLFAEVYAATGKQANLTLEDVNKPETAEYVADIERAVVHYGRSTGFFGEKLFNNGPSYLSAAVLYENMVIDSYKRNDLPFPVVAVYPSEGTFWSDHPVGVVQRDWVSDKHKEAAKIYLNYLLDSPQQERAMHYGFRPADVSIPLAAPIDPAHGVDPMEPKTTLEVPSVEVMDAIKKLWYQNKKHSNVILVLDTSGSMTSSQKMANAKEGALQLLNMLGEQDTFSLLPFNTKPSWAIQGEQVKEGREAARKKIQSLFAGGGTALYDAVSQANGYLGQNPQPGKISAIVVLSDGDDSSSSKKLPELLSELEFDSESHPVRVFTIGYGSGANSHILGQLAENTQAKFYRGNPENIRTVFREISTFF